MKKHTILSALMLIVGFALAVQAQTAKTSGIADVDFRNFGYSTLFDAKNIKLAEGKYAEDGGYDAGGSLYELFEKPVYGDLNNDGSDEAIVEIKMSAPPTLRDFEVQAFAFQKGKPTMLARINDSRVLADYQKYFPKGILHYAGVNAPQIKNGTVKIEALVDGNFACPKYTGVFSYKLTGGKFVLNGKPVRKAFDCSE